MVVEFVTKSADATMSTMVAQPYVNHIPTMTGGIGYDDLHRFYRDYFIPGNPPSLKMKLLSRTVGTDRVVDEMYMSFDHTLVMPVSHISGSFLFKTAFSSRETFFNPPQKLLINRILLSSWRC